PHAGRCPGAGPAAARRALCDIDQGSVGTHRADGAAARPPGRRAGVPRRLHEPGSHRRWRNADHREAQRSIPHHHGRRRPDLVNNESRGVSAMTRIAVPKETTLHDARVALTPETIARLVKKRFEVSVQRGAGLASQFSDADYEKAGARIEPDAD